MTQYIITYFGGNPPATPEEGKAHFAEYQKWLGSLGEKVVSPANPIKNTQSINPDSSLVNESISKMSGYTIIEVDSMNDAIAVSKNCPFLDIGGRLEVSELVKMSI